MTTERNAWIGYAALAWTVGYGLLGLYWALGGAGFPFGTERDPSAEHVSLLEHADAGTTGPAIAGLGLVATGVAFLMARRVTAVRTALIGFAWTMAVTLAVVVPDYRPLMAVARTPIYLAGLPFDWPEGVRFFGPGMFSWPVLNQLLLIAGGGAWAAAAVTYQRRIRGACGRCGRADVVAAWTTPAAAARWGRWFVATAIVIPVLYATTRWAWALGIPLGVTREALDAEARGSPGIWLAGAMLATLAVGGAVLTLGLVQRWGEVYPRWIPVLRGRPVRPRTAIVPASVVAVLIVTAGLMQNRALVLGYYPEGSGWATVGPAQLWTLWGVALGAATFAYYLRRRGTCHTCGRR